MKNLIKTGLISLVLLTLGGCSFLGIGEVYNANDFGMTVFKSLAGSKKNVYISPVGISLALGMMYDGSDGQTKKNFQKSMGLSSDVKDMNNKFNTVLHSIKAIKTDADFDMANSLWINPSYSINQEFITNSKKIFEAQAKSSLDITEMNDRVKDNTNGTITDLVDEVQSAPAVLVDALYFKGDWRNKFERVKTKKMQFIPADNSKVDTYFMNNTGKYKYFEDDGMQVAELLYGKGTSSMVIFLPKEGKTLDDFLNNLNGNLLNKYYAKFEDRYGNMSLPRFRVDYSIDLNQTVGKLGLDNEFTSVGNNFANLSSSTDIYIGKFLHGIHAEFLENSNDPDPEEEQIPDNQKSNIFDMNVNRPFFFVIKENKNNNAIIMGAVYNPTVN